MNFGIGQPVRRKEDFRLLTGRGCFSDDVNLEGQAYVHLLRSPHAHALIKGFDAAPALALPGVLAVLSGADYLADGLTGIPYTANPPFLGIVNRDGSDVFLTSNPPISSDKVRRVGEIVAVIVAESQDLARDGAERVVVDYEILPSVTDARAALAPGAPLVWDQVPGNLCIDYERGDAAATDAAFAAAAHITKLDLVNNRITGVPLEPRAAIGDYAAENESFTLHAGSQGPVLQKLAIAEIFKMPPEKVRVISKDVGGGYGTRNLMFAEFVMVLWASRRLGRPVKWVADREECFLSDPVARDIASQAELALDGAGRFLGLRVSHLTNLGTETFLFVPFTRSVDMVAGVYLIPAVYVVAKAAFTHSVPLSVYRGAGRPEAIFMIERLIDTAAAEMGLDPTDMRRLNIIPPTAIPHDTATGVLYDSGEFEKSMDGALKLADWGDVAARKAAARARGKYLGIGMGNYIEWATGIPGERAEVEILPEGRVQLVVGTMSSGQGHETAYAQVITELLGVPFQLIDLHEGDTARVKMGWGSHSSRSMRLAGTLLKQASDEIIERGKAIAAHVLEAAAADVEFAQARFTVAGTDRSLGIFEVARAAAERDDLPGGLAGKLESAKEILELQTTFPNGCHICEIEVDAETGAVQITRYAAIDDVGRVINPLLVDGQTQGGIAQGVGQALMEECIYDAATGQLLSGSFLDYGIPRADDFSDFKLGHNEVLAPNNPLGIKGAGEGGTTGAPPAVINAIVDALRELGVRHVEMPATPERIWQTIRAAHGG